MAHHDHHKGAKPAGVVSHIPGTEEHRLRHAAAVGGGNTRMDHAVHLSTAERTEEHRSRSAAIFEPSPVHPGGLGSTTHMTPSTGLGPGQHITLAEPGLVAPTAGTTLTSGSARGLDQDSLEPGEGPGYNSKTGGLAPMDAGTHPHNSWAGTRDVHPGRGTSGAVGMGGYTAEGKETVGHKIKKAIPGTREHEEKKIEQGRI